MPIHRKPSMYRRLELCSNRGGFEAIPEPARPIDLAEARRRLERAGIAVVDARVMLIAALEAEVTIARSGRLLFKTRDAQVAERALDRLAAILGFRAPSPEPGAGPADRPPARSGKGAVPGKSI